MKKLAASAIIAVSLMALTSYVIKQQTYEPAASVATEAPTEAAPTEAAPTEAAPTEAAPTGTREDLYIQALTDLYPDWEKYGDRSVAISTANNICALMDDSSVADAMETARTSAIKTGVEVKYVGSVGMAAVVTLCPQHRDAMDEWITGLN